MLPGVHDSQRKAETSKQTIFLKLLFKNESRERFKDGQIHRKAISSSSVYEERGMHRLIQRSLPSFPKPPDASPEGEEKREGV